MSHYDYREELESIARFPSWESSLFQVQLVIILDNCEPKSLEKRIPSGELRYGAAWAAPTEAALKDIFYRFRWYDRLVFEQIIVD